MTRFTLGLAVILLTGSTSAGWRDAKAYVRATYRNQLFVGGDDIAAGFRPVRTAKAK